MLYGKLPVVILADLAGGDNGTTNSQIASYILGHLNEVRNDSIRDLARKCFVSMSSISRFCRDVGFKDFDELRELLSDRSWAYEVYASDDNSNFCPDEYIKSVQESITYVQQSLDVNQLEKLVNDLYRYERVSAFGLLKAETAAICLQSDLLMMGKYVRTKIPYSKQIEMIMQATERDLILVFSYTGVYFNFAHSLEYSNFRISTEGKHAKIYLITSDPRIRSDDFVDEVIYFNSKQNQASLPYQLEVVAGLIAQCYAQHYLHREEDTRTHEEDQNE